MNIKEPQAIRILIENLKQKSDTIDMIVYFWKKNKTLYCEENPKITAAFESYVIACENAKNFVDMVIEKENSNILKLIWELEERIDDIKNGITTEI
jgi:predicted transport protein